ncbi:hypothetical protein NKH19_09935 [Mesorhizobium sp. M1338]|uniref:hypothetical protein n=1 Tax=Mesorhizobium sp. M1338 TaxID=2957085 RepID=UPI003339E5A6
MHKRAKPRLPYRLRNEGWWLVDQPRATAILIPFARKSPSAIRLGAIRKARS